MAASRRKARGRGQRDPQQGEGGGDEKVVIKPPDVPGGGGDSSGGGGGTSGGGASSSGGTSDAEQLAKARAQLKFNLRVRRRDALIQLQSYLHGLGLPTAPLRDTLKRLIKKQIKIMAPGGKKKGEKGEEAEKKPGQQLVGAISGSVSQADLLHSLMRDKQFKKMFPGIDKIVGSPALGKLTVGDAVSQWGQLANAFMVAQQQLGIDIGLDKKKLGFLITNNVSPDEFASRLMKWQSVQDGKLDAFNQAAQAAGMRPLTVEQFMTMSPKDFVDLHEAVAFQGFGISAGSARTLARAFGLMGEEVDVGAIFDVFRDVTGEIGQEVQQLGISKEDLIAGLASSGGVPIGDPALARRAEEVRQQVKQQLENRRAAQASRGGVQPQIGRSGQPVLPGPVGAGVQSL